MNHNKDYSEAEFRLFHSLGLADLTEHIPATGLYRIAMEKAFIKSMSGPNVEALRRACKALSECKPYRMTEEFDALVKW